MSHSCRFVVHLIRLGLIMVLAVLPFFAHSEVDKTPYISSVYTRLPALFYFISQQPQFLASLTQEEVVQFRKLHHLVRQNGFAMRETLNHDSTEIPHFRWATSRDQSRFQLSPDQPMRSAVTTIRPEDPIYFNLNMLNRDGIDYFDVLQLFIHEIGHKTKSVADVASGEAVHIERLTDSVAAKMIDFLTPFSRDIQVDESTRIFFFSLPVKTQVARSMDEFDHRPEIFVENFGQFLGVISEDRFSFSNRVQRGLISNYLRQKDSHGDLTNTLTYRLLDIEAALNGSALKMELVVEVQNRLRLMTPVTRLEMVAGNGHDQAVAMYPRENYLDIIPPEKFLISFDGTAFLNWEPEAPQYGLNFHTDFLKAPRWDYQAAFIPLTGANVRREEDRDTFRITMPSLPHHILALRPRLLVEGKSDVFFERLVSPKSSGVSHNELVFEIPRKQIPKTGAYVRSLTYGDSQKVSLPEVIAMEGLAEPPGPFEISSLGNIESNQFKPFTNRDVRIFSSRPLKFAFQAQKRPIQIRLRWIRSAQILSHGSSSHSSGNLGLYHKITEEVLEGEQIRKLKVFGLTDNAELMTYGFESSLPFEDLTVPYIDTNSFSSKNLGHVELKEIIFVADDGSAKSLHLFPAHHTFTEQYMFLNRIHSCEKLLVHP